MWAGVGHYPLQEDEPDLNALGRLARDEMVVAIGEIGLDFEHTGGPATELQIQRLDELFSIATSLDLPVSVHNRGA